MHFDILTLFPEMFSGVLNASILQRAQEMGLVTISLHNIRDYATDKHHVTDDTPYGGGGGMIMKPEPLFNAVEAVLGRAIPDEGYQPATGEPPIILLTPQGRLFSHAVARELARNHCRLLLVCGRYEGVDERVRQFLITDEISIGDYVLSGGEIPAMTVVDAVTRLIPGALGDPGATLDDSHATGLLEYPHYTRPAEYRGHGVPPILTSGHHAEIDRWRRKEALRRTLLRRPDLLETAPLSEADRALLARLRVDLDEAGPEASE
ncbi:MAG: tRNA (guanosine(37)-N1)-methyltransferase TrmD [Anaerolineae bacterium]